MKISRKKKLNSIIYHTFVAILAFLMVYPILWLISSSFKDPSEIFVNSHSLIPKKWSLDNYRQGWKGFGGLTFGVFFKNSFIITILSTIGQVVASTLVAYGFSRVKFKGRKIWFTCMIITMLLPSQVMIIPQYIFFSKLGWINSFKPLIIPSFFGLPFFIFLIMQFIQGIPFSLDESAYIDGCGKAGIFFRIIVPLIVPAIVTCTIFSFYWKWQEFMGPLLYLQKARKYPISVALKLFSDPAAVTNWGAMFAMSVLSLIPVFILFIMFQEYLVEGISTSGLKG